MIYWNILEGLGGSPMVRMTLPEVPSICLYAKAEFLNATGSIKDRAANFVLHKELREGKISKNTTIIESSSGNFGIAIAAYCRLLGLKFKCVIDPNINPTNKMLIEYLGAQIIEVNKQDKTGGYLLSRLAKIDELMAREDDCFWINQYSNPDVAQAYYETLGEEICREVNPLDYIFIGVGSGGTVSGVSQRVKLQNPNTQVIAVDAVGSVIFGHPPRKRKIPGIGASIRPKQLNKAIIDEALMIGEYDSAMGCQELLRKHAVFAGGSSGSVFAAIKRYFTNKNFDRPQNVVMLLADRGDRYVNTVYDKNWCLELKDEEACFSAEYEGVSEAI